MGWIRTLNCCCPDSSVTSFLSIIFQFSSAYTLNGGYPEIGPEITLTIPPLVNSKLAKTEFDEMKINVRTRMIFFIKVMLISCHTLSMAFFRSTKYYLRIYNISVFVPNPISGIHHNDKLYISICVSTLPDGYKKTPYP